MTKNQKNKAIVLFTLFILLAMLADNFDKIFGY